MATRTRSRGNTRDVQIELPQGNIDHFDVETNLPCHLGLIESDTATKGSFNGEAALLGNMPEHEGFELTIHGRPGI